MAEDDIFLKKNREKCCVFKKSRIFAALKFLVRHDDAARMRLFLWPYIIENTRPDEWASRKAPKVYRTRNLNNSHRVYLFNVLILV